MNSIKFTLEFSTTKIPYLDTVVLFGENNKLYTSLYTKPTDTHTYLHYRSAHPKHCKSAGPYSQLLRVKRICTKDDDFKELSMKILDFYAARDYPSQLLKDAFEKVQALNRQTLLQPRATQNTQDEQNQLFIITRYHPMMPPLKRIIQDNWGTLVASKYGPILKDKEVILGHRRPTNLKDLLVRSRISYPPTRMTPQITGVTEQNPCDTNQCRYCSKMDTSGAVKSTHTGRNYSTPPGGTCKHNNLVYLLTCQTCNKQYVGQTSRRLMDRLREHFYYINKSDRLQPLGRHFARADHGVLNLKVQILEHINTPPKLKKTETFRLKREFFWIHQLCTMEPFGLNVMGK